MRGIDKKGHYYSIEIQVNDDEHFDKHAFYHCMALFQGTFCGPFYMTRKAISIHVMNFDRFKGEEEEKKEKIEDLIFAKFILLF
jgi:hypothetical protein